MFKILNQGSGYMPDQCAKRESQQVSHEYDTQGKPEYTKQGIQ